MNPAFRRIESSVERIPIAGCWIWTGYIDGKGYGRTSIPGESGVRVHRVVWEAMNRKLLPGECVLHRCDTPACCNPDHLFVGSRADNNADKAMKDRGSKKLNSNEVRRIREMAGTHQEIADLFGVSRSMVTQIKNLRFRRFS